jgi:hypothetical protein
MPNSLRYKQSAPWIRALNSISVTGTPWAGPVDQGSGMILRYYFIAIQIRAAKRRGWGGAQSVAFLTNPLPDSSGGGFGDREVLAGLGMNDIN